VAASSIELLRQTATKENREQSRVPMILQAESMNNGNRCPSAIESAWRGLLSLRDPAGAEHAAGPPEFLLVYLP
jgi:hypothetical protein